MKEKIGQNNRSKVALITGASGGLGWATAIQLAEDGYHVCVFARREYALNTLAEEIRALNQECLVVAGDVTQPADVENAVALCIERFGKIDVLINNAAIQIYANFEDYTWEEITRVNDVNYFGYLRFARAVLPGMRKRKSGKILNVLSVMEQGGLQLFSAYSASKHALMGWSKCLKLELKGTGIELSNVILPAMNTPLYDHCETKMGVAPKPLPPIYNVAVGVRSIQKAIRSPSLNHVPVFLQGRLILWSDYFSPQIGNFILNLIGYRGQVRKNAPVPTGNTWKENPTGVGPKGTLPETPAYVRYSPLILAAVATAFLLIRSKRSKA
jgi:NAD(P)-dependent dehydrogenase (short-subunit alcohol dehydrogenase family)